jgi:hypothetical protein
MTLLIFFINDRYGPVSSATRTTILT